MKQTSNHYNCLLDIIKEYIKPNNIFFYNIDCIENTLEYEDLDNYFKSFFGKDFKYDKVYKLYYNCYIYNNYIIKFSYQKVPAIISKESEYVKCYFRKNYSFFNNDKCILNLGVEIQDYLKDALVCTKEEIYSLYKSLRNKGYIWMDANIGNALKYKGTNYIVDLDFIYLKEDAIYSNQSDMSKEFEIRYKNEK